MHVEIVNSSPFKVGPLVAQPLPHQYTLSLIVKGTFRLTPGSAAVLADEQFFPTGDEPYPDDTDAAGGPRYESDFAPYKPRCDLLLVGKCYAPAGRPTERCSATFRVGGVSKTIDIVAERHWRYAMGVFPKLSEPVPFTEMELRYERSYGGPGFQRNPVGKGHRVTKGADGQRIRPVPNLVPPGYTTGMPLSRVAPSGFGPLNRLWRDRFTKTGTYNKRWIKNGWPCFPDDFDWGFFNSSPPDLQCEQYLRGDEELYFENLHPEHPQYHARLPGLRVRCYLNERESDDGEPPSFGAVPMHLDTLWVDMEAEQLVLVWRGITNIRSDDYAEIAHVFVVAEDLDEPERSDHEYRLMFEQHLAAAEELDAFGIELPDLSAATAQAESLVAGKLAEAVDAQALNRQFDDIFGKGAVQFPSGLKSLGLGAQLVALDGFMNDVSSAVDRLADEQVADVRAHLAAGGRNLTTQSEEDARQLQAELGGMLKELGIDDDLREADADMKQAAHNLHRLGIDFAAAGVDLGVLSGGLKGVGVDLAGLGISLGDDPPPLTRDSLPNRLAAGEGFAGALLAGIDLSGLALQRANFREAILSDATLANSDLSEADLRGAILPRVDLSGAKLRGADLTGADLTAARLNGADLTGAILVDAVFQQANMQDAVLDRASARDANFQEADLTGGSLKSARLPGADFSRSTLDEADLQQSFLQDATFDAAAGTNTNFTAANLTRVRATQGCAFPAGRFHQVHGPESNWTGADLAGTDFSFARMVGAFFNQADLSGANLSAADCKQARFTKANLQGAVLAEANLFEAAIDKADLTAADLRGSNAYGGDFYETIVEDVLFDEANLRMTLLAEKQTGRGTVGKRTHTQPDGER
jgi:uncharacterized protein YjbI with pentapeptide repeats